MRISLFSLMAAAVALLIVACGGTEETIKEVVVEKQVVVEKEVVKEVPVEKIVEKVVIKEVPVEKVVEKVVIKEVEVEKEVIKRVVREVVATAMPLTGGMAVQQAKYGGELKVTSQGSISSLDPGFGPAYVTYAVGSQVFEYPFGLDLDYNIRPQMVSDYTLSADGLTWTFTLREGLQFHNGKALTSDHVVNSYPRWIESSGGGQFVHEYLEPNGIQKTDDRTWTMKFTRTLGGVPEVMGWMYRGFWIFDEGLSSVSSKEDGSQGGITNLIGSGPYKITEWEVGNKVVIERYDGYIPRSEPGSYLAGAKEAYLDKITWLEIPSEETKIAGLKTGEWDLVDGAGLDHFFPLSDEPTINISTYPFHHSFISMAHGVGPTDNEKVRQAIEVSMDMEQLMSSLGPSELWFLCPAVYYCGTPLETNIGASEWYNQNDIPRAKALLAEAGYKGEEVLLMNPTDFSTITPLGPVLKAQLEDAGINVNMPGMDWSTLISKVFSLTWNLHTSWTTHIAFGSPIHDLANTVGGGGYGGGFTFQEMIDGKKEFAFAKNDAERLAAAEKIQLAYFIHVPRVYLGQWASLYPYRTYLKNLTTPSYPMYIHAWLEK